MYTDLNENLVIQNLQSSIFHIEVLETVSSTNTIMKEMAKDGAPELSVLIAESQSGGRGRMGRDFYSPPGTGIYMSILLRPDISADKSLFMTAYTAVICAETLENISKKPASIKWVNDIYIDNRKVCGILTESSVNAVGGIEYAVIGIGINVSPPEKGFPEDIRGRAGALFDKSGAVNRSLIAARLLNSFAEYYLSENTVLSDKKMFLEKYRRRSFLTGKEIDIIYPDSVKRAKAIGIDDDFSLIVSFPDGVQKHLIAGDVSVRFT